MNKEYFLQIADYNIWANNIVVTWLQQLTQKQWQQPITSSFGSIEATILHIVSAEKIWQERLTKQPQPQWIADTYEGTKTDIIILWQQAAVALKKFIEDHCDNHILQEPVTFARLNGDVYTIPYYQALAHVFNHSTFHRGQIITLLRQVGFTLLSSTDMLGFFRK